MRKKSFKKSKLNRARSNELARAVQTPRPASPTDGRYEIERPSGNMEVPVDVDSAGEIGCAGIIRTARKLFRDWSLRGIEADLTGCFISGNARVAGQARSRRFVLRDSEKPKINHLNATKNSNVFGELLRLSANIISAPPADWHLARQFATNHRRICLFALAKRAPKSLTAVWFILSGIPTRCKLLVEPPEPCPCNDRNNDQQQPAGCREILV